MLVRLYVVRCNGCGKVAGGVRDLVSTSREAYAHAKRQRWLRIPKRSGMAGGSPGADYCPECAGRESTRPAAEREGTLDR